MAPDQIKILQYQRGITLIELLITIVIVSLLAIITLPSYAHVLRKMRRSIAIQEIQTISHLQNVFMSECHSYTGNFGGQIKDGDGKAVCTGLGLFDQSNLTSKQSSGGYYESNVTLENCSNDRCRNFVVTVVASLNSSQSKDSLCQKFNYSSIGAWNSEDSSGTDTSQSCL